MIPIFDSSATYTNGLQSRPEQLHDNIYSPHTFVQQDCERTLTAQHHLTKDAMHSCFRFPQCVSTYPTEIKQEGSRTKLAGVQVWLEHQALWRRFSLSGNEMIITKMGRRMFPVLAFGVYNLNQTEFYSMEVVVVPADNNRYKYVSASGWRVNGVASEHEGNKHMLHPDGVQNGDYWHRNGVAFKRIKLTNKKTAKEGSNQIVLNSMHKYQIQLVIKKVDEKQKVLEQRKFVFKETAFIAVTAYQNDDITQLKIDHNPFAKAFRDTNAENSAYCQSTDDIYSISPKRRRCNDISIASPSPTPVHHNSYPFHLKHGSNYAYDQFAMFNNIPTTTSTTNDVFFRKAFPMSYEQSFPDRNFVSSVINANTNNSVVNMSTPSWYAPMAYNTDNISSLDMNSMGTSNHSNNHHSNNHHSNSETNNYWNFPKVEDQLLSPCSV